MRILLVLLLSAALPGWAANFNVTTSGATFSPNSLVLTVGDTVTWNGLSGHTVYVDDTTGTCINNYSVSGSIQTFNLPGVFHFHCSFHSSCGTSSCSASCTGMVGTLTVNSPTATKTTTGTPTDSPTPTITDSPTTTVTPPGTFTDSPTPSPTPTISDTLTHSPLPTATDSFTHSPTLTPSFSQSPTPSATPSATPTATESTTLTPGSAATATSLSFPAIDRVSAVPNPAPAGQPLTIAYHLLAPAEKITARLYSPAFQLVKDWDLGPKNGVWNLDALDLPPLAGQLYYLQMTSSAGGHEVKSPITLVYLVR